MGWLQFAGLILQFVVMIMQYLERNKAINEGLAQAVQILVEKANDLINRADEYRDSVSDDPAVLLRDEYNRDREAGGNAAKTDTVQIVLPRKI